MRWMRSVLAVAALAAMMSAHAERDFSGQTPSGAYYRIAVPDNWKPGQVLVMYQHGLDFGGADPDPSLGPLKDLQISEGYAVAASSYRQRGWALFTAPDDNAELLSAFKQLVGTPGAIVPFGASLGGLISLKMAEDSRFAPVPGVYAACPPAAGTRAWDEAIDLRLAYDVICKGAGDLPTGDQPTPWAYNLGDIPSNLSDLQDKAQLLQTLIPVNLCTGINLPSEIRNGAMKRRLAQLMALGHITDEDFFVTNMGYATYALSDLVRAPDKLNGLNPFSTIGVDYGDATLDADIARISPEPFGQLYFKWSSDFRGRVSPSTKVISIQTSQDQLVIPANQDVLRHTLPASQLTSALVNEASPTHCGFTLAEGVAGWEALRAWVGGAPQPTVNDLQNTCNAATAQGAAGPCRYDASITVPSFDSQVQPRQASAAPPVDAHYSGQWYDPARSGEGISLEILGNGKAAVYFFTQPPKDVAGKQSWLFGVGDVVGNGVEFADVELPALDASGNFTSTRWGRIGLVFDDCGSGAMRWDGPPDWGSMEVPLKRLTSLQSLGCGIQGGTPPSVNAVSGAWSDANYNGRGFVFEQLDAQRIDAIWFGFDNSGVPVWLTGILDQDQTGGYAGSMVQAFGTHFGADFDSASIQRAVNGTLSVSSIACNIATTTFQTAAGQLGLMPASLAPQRFTIPLGMPSCAP